MRAEHRGRNERHPPKRLRRAAGWAALLLLSPALAAQPQIEFVEALFDGGMDQAANPIDGLGQARGIDISADGLHVYVASQADDAIAVFARDGSTGVLTFVEAIFDGGMDQAANPVDGLESAANVAVSPDGKHVYVAAGTDDAVAVFSRNAGSGVLTFVEALFNLGMDQAMNPIEGLNGARGVRVSPDDNHVYVASNFQDDLAVFSRNTTSGVLTFVEFLRDGGLDQALNTVDGLDGGFDVVLSPDGKHVYVGSDRDDGVAVFSRNAATGVLTYVEALLDGGTDGMGNPLTLLNGTKGLEVSPDGKHVYVTSNGESAVTVFSRNATSGELTLVEELANGGTDQALNPIDGLGGAEGIDVSADSELVVVAGFTPGALAFFQRDTNSGVLTFLDAQTDGVGAVDGLGGAFSVAITPDGMHEYAPGLLDSGIAAFAKVTPLFADGFETGNTNAWSAIAP